MALNDIKHFFVLMMENRSFDHLLGASGITGTDVSTGKPTKINGAIGSYTQAPYVIEPDPPHEFDDVLTQLCGKGSQIPAAPKNTYPTISPTPMNAQGFIDSYKTIPSPPGDVNDPIYYPNRPPPPLDPNAVLSAFTPSTLPILTTLARQFAVCDNWFSSLPGPTWPNRYFLHAGTSGGVVASPLSICSFTNGTIFDKLENKGISWKVYHHGIAQILSIEGMFAKLLTSGNDGGAGISGAANLRISKLGLDSIEHQILNGRGDMPPFKSVLTKEQIKKLAVYVLSLRN